MGSQHRAEEGAPPADRAKPLVLLVDDDADNRDMYATYLERRGFDVGQADDGSSALAQSRALQPDLVVMDLTLPDMDGLQVIHQLDADPVTAFTPVIIVSGHRLEKTPNRKSPDGEPLDAFLSKPCAPDVLVEKIRQLIKQRGARGGARTRGSSPL